MHKKYGRFEWDENNNRFEHLLEKIEDLLQSLYNKTINKLLDNRPDQKIKVKVDKYDVWGMDCTLSHIIYPMLLQLKEDKEGAPFVDDEDVPEELKSTSAPPKKNDWDTDDNHFKRWDYVLDEMIWSFEQKKRSDWEGDFYEYEDDPSEDLGLKLVWEDKEGQKKHQDRMTNGFRLFGKYYEHLWS
jgi:hypothetical protein